MTEFYHPINEIIADFHNNEIDISYPGFYDEPNFIRVEQSKPEYLNNYARFVQSKKYSEDYLKNARNVIPIIANELHKELIRDGRQGACIDMSMLLSRILDKEGFWNYIVKGSLTVSFPKDSGISDRYFWSIDHGSFSAGHAWVVAPPFGVIDLTIKQQERAAHEYEFIPDLIICENLKPATANACDIISPEIIRDLLSQGLTIKNMIPKLEPVISEVLATFKTGITTHEKTSFKYVPVAFGASDRPLEEMHGLSDTGMSAIDIYTLLVKPKLELVKNLTKT